MGCVSSSEAANEPVVARAKSIEQSVQRTGEPVGSRYQKSHEVSLTSSTLGALKVETPPVLKPAVVVDEVKPIPGPEANYGVPDDDPVEKAIKRMKSMDVAPEDVAKLRDSMNGNLSHGQKRDEKHEEEEEVDDNDDDDDAGIVVNDEVDWDDDEEDETDEIEEQEVDSKPSKDLHHKDTISPTGVSEPEPMPQSSGPSSVAEVSKAHSGARVEDGEDGNVVAAESHTSERTTKQAVGNKSREPAPVLKMEEAESSSVVGVKPIVSGGSETAGLGSATPSSSTANTPAVTVPDEEFEEIIAGLVGEAGSKPEPKQRKSPAKAVAVKPVILPRISEGDEDKEMVKKNTEQLMQSLGGPSRHGYSLGRAVASEKSFPAANAGPALTNGDEHAAAEVVSQESGAEVSVAASSDAQSKYSQPEEVARKAEEKVEVREAVKNVGNKNATTSGSTPMFRSGMTQKNGSGKGMTMTTMITIQEPQESELDAEPLPSDDPLFDPDLLNTYEQAFQMYTKEDWAAAMANPDRNPRRKSLEVWNTAEAAARDLANARKEVEVMKRSVSLSSAPARSKKWQFSLGSTAKSSDGALYSRPGGRSADADFLKGDRLSTDTSSTRSSEDLPNPGGMGRDVWAGDRGSPPGSSATPQRRSERRKSVGSMEQTAGRRRSVEISEGTGGNVSSGQSRWRKDEEGPQQPRRRSVGAMEGQVSRRSSSLGRDPWALDEPQRTRWNPSKNDKWKRFEMRCPPQGQRRLVLYTTTLRGVRKTFEDCNSARDILQSYHVTLDERDVSLHQDYRQELKVLVEGLGPSPVPRLFIRGHHIGGIEEIEAMNEDGSLAPLVAEFVKQEKGPHRDCESCGGARFVPCETCHGSTKVVQGDEVVRCSDCNENGLTRCSACS